MASRTQEKKNADNTNKAVRFIHGNKQEQLNTEQLHKKYGITPLNISIFQRAKQFWETIRISENEQYTKLITPHTHTWFPKSSNIIEMESPQALIT